MSTTLTIRNLDADVRQGLRMLAASHQRSMEAEAREIIRRAVNDAETHPKRVSREEAHRRVESVSGIWKGHGTTDELMRLTRG